MRRRVVAAASLLCVAACAGPAAPSAAAPVAGPAAGPAAVATRPRSVPVQGLDPCSVLSPDQLRQVGVGPESQTRTPASADNGNAPTCVWIEPRPTDPFTNVYVQGVTSMGIDEVHDRSPGSMLIDVDGFRAVQRDSSTPEQPSCEIYVDVADGQALEVAYGYELPRDPALACPTAVQLASTALSVLLSR